jgi:hypothetical protein
VAVIGSMPRLVKHSRRRGRVKEEEELAGANDHSLTASGSGVPSSLIRWSPEWRAELAAALPCSAWRPDDPPAAAFPPERSGTYAVTSTRRSTCNSTAPIARKDSR